MKQGATGEGTFGGVGDPNATASGRYDRETSRAGQRSETRADTLICFCGSRMSEVGSGQRTRVTRAGLTD